MEWYYANENDQQIPLDEGNLEDLIAIGTIKKNTLVWHEGMGDWKECGQVKPELFAAETAAATTPSEDGGSSLPATASTMATTPSPPPMSAGQPPAMPSHPSPPQQDGMAITSMICGIIGVCTFWCWGMGFIPALVAVITGHISKKKLTNGEKSPMATAGLVTGWIGLVLSVLMFGLLLFLVISEEMN